LLLIFCRMLLEGCKYTVEILITLVFNENTYGRVSKKR